MGVHTANYDAIRNELNITDDEPIFIIRAQDDASLATLADYMTNAKNNRASKHFLDDISEVIWRFGDWRVNNESKCKTPD
jgi:hypothetical protein